MTKLCLIIKYNFQHCIHKTYCNVVNNYYIDLQIVSFNSKFKKYIRNDTPLTYLKKKKNFLHSQGWKCNSKHGKTNFGNSLDFHLYSQNKVLAKFWWIALNCFKKHYLTYTIYRILQLDLTVNILINSKHITEAHIF